MLNARYSATEKQKYNKIVVLCTYKWRNYIEKIKGMIIIKVRVVVTSGGGESAKMGNRVTVGVLRKSFWNSGNILILDLGDD